MKTPVERRVAGKSTALLGIFTQTPAPATLPWGRAEVLSCNGCIDEWSKEGPWSRGCCTGLLRTYLVLARRLLAQA